MPSKAFIRRIKTHITGPVHRFAVIVPPELAQICLNEMIGIDIPGPQVSEAGIEFSGRMKDACNCNLWLRTASRVLCRLDPFRAGIAEELFYKTSQIPWELWLNPDIPIDIESHVEYSRISHEGRVAEIISESIEKSLRERAFCLEGEPQNKEKLADDALSADPLPLIPIPDSGTPRRLKQKILARIEKNHCQISLDMSGDHLHERGYRLLHTGAPLRETLAAAILLKSGWTGDTDLIDGMCGSGTLAIEAALISRRIAPGIGREFLFQRWPSFQKQTWDYLRRKATESSLPKSPQKIIGIDLDPEAIRVSEENANRAGVVDDIEWKLMDFFDFDPAKRGLSKGLLVLNPPYGVRLSSEGSSLYERIGAHLKFKYKGWKYAVFAGSRVDAAALGTGRVRLWNIRHGGIPITVAMGRIGE